jgi:hypothetical protein
MIWPFISPNFLGFDTYYTYKNGVRKVKTYFIARIVVIFHNFLLFLHKRNNKSLFFKKVKKM